MFEATKWSLKENDENSGNETCLSNLSPPRDAAGNGYYSADTNIEVIKRFEFVAKLQRMSTIVKDPKENKQRVYVKGSPEVLSTLCKTGNFTKRFCQSLTNLHSSNYTSLCLVSYVFRVV